MKFFYINYFSVDKLERDLVAFLERQQDEQTAYLGKIQQEKVEFDRRQAGELERLEKKQQEETGSLQQPGSRQSDNNSPKSALCTSRPSSRYTSLSLLRLSSLTCLISFIRKW